MVAKIKPERLGAYLRMRRSIRRYKKEPVQREIIRQLMDTVRFAPTGHNRHDVRWLIIHDTGELRRLTGMAVDWMREAVASGSPLVERFHMSARVNAWEQGRDSICRLAPHLVVAYVHEANPFPEPMRSSPLRTWRSSLPRWGWAPAGAESFCWL